MRLPIYVSSLLLLSNWAESATLTVTEVKTVDLLDSVPTSSDSDVYITTTVFAYETSSPVVVEDMEQESLKPVREAKSSVDDGIDMIPIIRSPDKVLKGSTEDPVQVGFDKNYFEKHLENYGDDELHSSSPYHLQPGYMPKSSPEEQSKISDPKKYSDAHEIPTPTTDDPETEPDEVPRGPLTTHGLPVGQDLPANYEDDMDLVFYSAPTMSDDHLLDILMWEKMPTVDVPFHGLEKEPYKGREPGEVLEPPVNKIITEHLPPLLRATPTQSLKEVATSSSSVVTRPTSTPGGDSTNSSDTSDGSSRKSIDRLLNLKKQKEELKTKTQRKPSSHTLDRKSLFGSKRRSRTKVTQKSSGGKLRVPALLGALVAVSFMFW